MYLHAGAESINLFICPCREICLQDYQVVPHTPHKEPSNILVNTH